MDYDVPDARHATIFPVEPLAVTLKFERVLLSGMLRYGPAIMCRILVLCSRTTSGPLTGLTPLQTPSSEPFPCTEASPGESKAWGQ